jgi:hypothetical protein
MSTKSVHKLTQDSVPGFFLIGIASYENDYRISWALNTSLGFNFIKSDYLSSVNKRLDVTQEFSMYYSQETNNFPFCRLISNRCDNGFLFEELKNIDFILTLEKSGDFMPDEAFIRSIRTIPFISMAILINTDILKSVSRIK